MSALLKVKKSIPMITFMRASATKRFSTSYIARDNLLVFWIPTLVFSRRWGLALKHRRRLWHWSRYPSQPSLFASCQFNPSGMRSVLSFSKAFCWRSQHLEYEKRCKECGSYVWHRSHFRPTCTSYPALDCAVFLGPTLETKSFVNKLETEFF